MSLIITGVIDGPLPGGLPKALEVFVTADIADLSIYGLGSANNGGGSDGEEFTFPATSATAGSYIYISSESIEFENFFGFAPDFTSGALSVNGDDAIELFENGSVIDTFGEINVDGTGQPWEYLDGWAARNLGATASPTFDITQWSFSGPNALDGEINNGGSLTPFPAGEFGTTTPDVNFVINEIDADQTGTDSAEFIEIYDGGAGNSSLDGLSLVLFNGNGDAVYDTISLDGLTTDENGYFVVGSANVPNVDLIEFTTNGLQNGADGVALYSGTPPTSATTDNLVDALVYGTSDAEDTELLLALGLGSQFDENANGNKDIESLSRLPNGTGTFTTQAPTPGASNGGEEPQPVFVINEVDADQTGTDSAEFIEIYDGGVGNESLDGLSIVLFNGNGDAAYNTISLDGLTTDENGYFVIGSANVPNVDLVEFTTNGLQNGADAVALYSGTPPEAATTENLLDAIVYDTNDADDVELLAALGLTEQLNEDGNGNKDTESLSRVPDGDGGFVTQAPTPGATNVIEPPVEITLISEIQGAAPTSNLAEIGIDDRSALEGQIVTVRAIVTADFQDGLLGAQGDLNGFYIQEEEVDYDFNDLTSEGIFIFDGFTPSVDVNIGDLVEITGTVSEFNGETQISASAVAVLETDQMLPTAVDVEFPTATVLQDDNGNYVANLEAYEGMLVNVAQDMTVSELFNLDRFGQYNVTSDGRPVQFTQDNAPDVAGFEQHLQETAARTLVLDDGLTVQNPDLLRIIDGNDGVLTAEDSFRMGDTISEITGVVGYSFDEFRIQAAEGVYEQTAPRPTSPDELGGNFKVASLNVLNYFTTIDESGVTTDIGADPRGADSIEEFERQAEKLVNAIVEIDADVLGLIEIENDFAGDSFAIEDLVDRVNAAIGEDVYAFVDPGQEFVGTDAISNGMIYRTDRVDLNGEMAILTEFDGRNFLDPLDAGRDLNRAAIAQTFEDVDTGQTITISVNHLKSKGSLSGLPEDEAQGDGQGRNNATRTEAADILADWLASDPTGQGSENTLILGDLNAYAQEDPLTVLADAGYTDLAAAELGDDAYSFVFDGQIGTLDYALANEALADNVVGVTEWHINADEADAIDYNLDFGRDPTLFDGDSPARNSDHDPVIVSFEFEPVFNEIAGTNRRDVLFGTEDRDEIEALRGNDVIFAGGGGDRIIAGAGNDIVFAGAGDDTIVAGPGRRDFAFGGDGADTFEFSAAIAEDNRRDKLVIADFDVSEDMINLGGAEISDVRQIGPFLRISLEGGRDKIDLWGVSDFDEIMFVGDDVPMV